MNVIGNDTHTKMAHCEEKMQENTFRTEVERAYFRPLRNISIFYSYSGNY